MTGLLALLAVGVVTQPWTPPIDPEGPPPGEPGTPIGPPEVDDPLVMAMRPDVTPVARAVVQLDGSGHFTSLADAVDWLDGRQAILAVGAPISPAHRVEILLGPGDHASMPQPPKWCSVIALDPTPNSTRLMQGIETNHGLYMEGVDITNLGPTPSKYAVHLYNKNTNIFTRCTWESSSEGGGNTTIGMDGDNGGTVVMHDVVMVGGGTNLHGWASLSVPQDIVFSQVIAPTMVGYGDDSGVGDDVWMVGCDVPSVQVAGPNSRLHFDQALNPGVVVSGSSTAQLDARSDWPVPTGGLSARDRTEFGL